MIFEIKTSDGHTHYYQSKNVDNLKREADHYTKDRKIRPISSKEANEIKVVLYEDNDTENGERFEENLLSQVCGNNTMMLSSTDFSD